ncbi:aromatic-ring-hydroxylating dioxygenase subunit beta [Bradyrhizobium iriomotense]|uniref:aromatic-ring-hydroxylating dioxygenase subunit beta n=1 Tax=Bradyrhizobium iriomotense TaxID=441950 RepID=UPI001B8A3DDC|nr:aromatic-ring-hydroxylating dioxygenase subunit beta [Bradyrhizobium iriomotense]MBR1130825.1 aromatic-ring-hydroxylating dioxygenase subunit beta [Bradyrhizobium iriomotense]
MHKVLNKPSKQGFAPTRDQVVDLIAAYAHSVDDMRLDAWPQFFTSDALYHVTTRENHEAGLPIGVVRCVGRGMMQDRVKAFYSANIFEPHTYSHIVGRSEFLEQKSDMVISARSNFQIVRTMESGRMDVFAVGRYIDDVVIEDGQARFRQRLVILDSRNVDILIVIPL